MKQPALEPEWVEAIEWSNLTPKSLPEAIVISPHPKQIDNRLSQSVMLRQSPFWSRAILWGLLGLISTTVGWACLAQFEEAIPAPGQLKPQGAVKEIQAPVTGVVKLVHVKDGQRVKKGDRLLSLDTTAAKAQLSSLTKIRSSLVLENQFYQMQMAGVDASTHTTFANLQIPTPILALTKNRIALLAENQTYRAQLSGSSRGMGLSLDQTAQVQAVRVELNSRKQAALLEKNQLERQLEQAQIQVDDAKMTWDINQKILNDMEPLVKEGAIPRLQYLKQVQEVNTGQANIHRLTKEVARLRAAIAQAQAQQQTVTAQFERDLRVHLAENEKRIAEIDGQLNKAIVENEKRMAEIDNEISQAKLALKYQEIMSPADGIVFDLQARTPGFVAQTSQMMLKVVPEDALIAEILITNKDIGFVKPGMTVDIRIDSFPYSEFGDIKGKLIWIGSDVLPPTETRPVYSFPARIQLDQQSLSSHGRDILLKSGMSIQANIKVRQRRVISIFTDLFVKQVDSLTSVR